MFSGQSPAGFNGRYVYVKASLDLAGLSPRMRRVALEKSSPPVSLRRRDRKAGAVEIADQRKPLLTRQPDKGRTNGGP